MESANGSSLATKGLLDWRPTYADAVEVRGVHKSYRSGRRKKSVVLQGITMSVPKGAIYGLLGPSGCGKTTLLRMIVGRLKMDSGCIKVFGDSPGTRDCGIPGEKVGYMPQEMALYIEFTIRETMHFFGRVHNMSNKDIDKRMKFLLDLLHLPKESRFIKSLSGGQKRRVSFAVALLQEPPLLILDEPTMGVDPLLRQNIWNHLFTLAQGGNTTIIITTHYIEEARQADVVIDKRLERIDLKVGFIRNGRILAENSPDNLLSTYECGNLENVFVKLCVADKTLHINTCSTDCNQSIVQDKMGLPVPATLKTQGAELQVTLRAQPKPTADPPLVSERYNKALAIIVKNFIQIGRNIGMLLFQVIIPSILIILTYMAIGHKPVGLDMAYVNHDNDSSQYGKAFLNAINEENLILHPYDDLDSAMDAVKVNEVWGVIYLPLYYSQHLLNRSFNCMDIEDEILEGSKIRVWLDMSNQHISSAVQVELIETLQNFRRKVLEENGINPGIAELPLSFEAPIDVNREQTTLAQSTIAGLILSIVYYMAMAITALSFVVERKEGLLERTYVAGVGTTEIMLGHFFTQFVVMLAQVGLLLFFMIVAFKIPCHGPAFWVIILLILQGSCGMFYGLFISAACDEEHFVIIITLSSACSSMMLSGSFWPIEGMPTFLRYISYGLPQTYPTKAVWAMMFRGWGIMEMQMIGQPLKIMTALVNEHVQLIMEAANGSLATNGLLDWRSTYTDAVEVRGVHKSYGSGRKKSEVLQGITMSVPTGAIYGLLGPSGCGKTTLLRMIVGRLKMNAGYIKVFGDIPGTRDCGIPGEKVGYMPQEMALYIEFTIRETMHFFGRVHNMSNEDIDRRMKMLLEVLHLPKETRFIKSLSGGQKRRVSFAVALLQEPPLLILDEPTVGVDPVLRQDIWNHLITIAKSDNTTIIITTHYIEEARQADVVGLMRNGQILAENSPDNLLSTYQCGNLEDVFLKLCNADQNLHRNTNSTDYNQSVVQAHGAEPQVTLRELPKHTADTSLICERYHVANLQQRKPRPWFAIYRSNKVMAMIMKNFKQKRRNAGTTVIEIILPAILIIIFFLAIGHQPIGLDMAYVNHDNNSADYGKVFLNAINKENLILHPYDNLDSAIDALKVNEVWGVVYLPSNYSQNLLSRLYGCMDIESEVLEGSKIRVWLDMTNLYIWYTLQFELVETLQTFMRKTLGAIGINPELAELPLSFETPVYGKREEMTFTEFIAPGLSLSFTFFIAMGLTALALVVERKEGLLDRTFVAGVDTVEIMLGHFITEFFVMLVQVGLFLFFMIVVFQVPCRGLAFWVIILIILQGSCGMFYGLFISAFCDEEHSAVMFAVGSFFPGVLLSGTFWSLQGIPIVLRYISYGLPQTYPTEALQAMMFRGWGITEMQVWRGFLITLGWLAFFITATTISMRMRQ